MADWGIAPTILIFGDTDEGLAFAMDSAERQGGRVAAALPFAAAIDRLDSQISVDLVMLDVAADHGAVLDRLLRMIDGAAASGRFSGLVTVSPDLVDIVSARVTAGEVSLVVGRDHKALDAAVGERLSHRVIHMREDDEEANSDLADVLQGEMLAAGRTALAQLREDSEGYAASPSGDELSSPAASAATIRDIIRARRLREELFGSAIFADPAWDILLDLTAAKMEGRSVAVSSLCIAAAVPATTALRWIKQLTDGGFLRRVADPDDGRRVFIEMTDRASAAMDIYLRALPPFSRS